MAPKKLNSGLNFGLNSEKWKAKLFLKAPKLEMKKHNELAQLKKQRANLFLSLAKPVISLVLPPLRGLNSKLGDSIKKRGLNRKSPLYG